MKFTFTRQDFVEISSSAYVTFISIFQVRSGDNVGTDSDFSDSDSDLPYFESSTYGCGEVTTSIEVLIEDRVEDCIPLVNVYASGSEIIKQTIIIAKEETI